MLVVVVVLLSVCFGLDAEDGISGLSGPLPAIECEDIIIARYQLSNITLFYAFLLYRIFFLFFELPWHESARAKSFLFFLCCWLEAITHFQTKSISLVSVCIHVSVSRGPGDCKEMLLFCYKYAVHENSQHSTRGTLSQLLTFLVFVSIYKQHTESITEKTQRQ